MKIYRLLACLLLLAASCTRPEGWDEDPAASLAAQRPRPDFTVADSSRIVTYPSGLRMYMVLEGPGNRPAEGARVRMHYRGTLANGTVFHDTRTEQQPFTFALGKTALIPGMEEAVRKLRFGSRAVAIIPPELGYPPKETPHNIPPKSTLIFELEMLGTF